MTKIKKCVIPVQSIIDSYHLLQQLVSCKGTRVISELQYIKANVVN